MSTTHWRIRLELRPPDNEKTGAIIEHTLSPVFKPLIVRRRSEQAQHSPEFLHVAQAIGSLSVREQFAQQLAPVLARMLVEALERRPDSPMPQPTLEFRVDRTSATPVSRNSEGAGPQNRQAENVDGPSTEAKVIDP